MDQSAEEPAIVELFRHNTWATLKLLDACAALTDAQLDLSAPGTFGTIRDTLGHLVRNEENYLSALTAEPVENPVRRGEFPGIAGLHERFRLSGERLAREAARVRLSDTVVRDWGGETVTVRPITLLAQAINHATEHRAHITTILGQNGIEPPVLDVWTYADEIDGEAV